MRQMFDLIAAQLYGLFSLLFSSLILYFFFFALFWHSLSLRLMTFCINFDVVYENSAQYAFTVGQLIDASNKLK